MKRLQRGVTDGRAAFARILVKSMAGSENSPVLLISWPGFVDHVVGQLVRPVLHHCMSRVSVLGKTIFFVAATGIRWNLTAACPCMKRFSRHVYQPEDQQGRHLVTCSTIPQQCARAPSSQTSKRASRGTDLSSVVYGLRCFLQCLNLLTSIQAQAVMASLYRCWTLCLASMYACAPSMH